MTTALHSNSLATLLLCSRLALPADESGAKALTTSRWRQLVDKLTAAAWQPGDLIGWTAAEIEQRLSVKSESADLIARLLDRSGQMAFELERLDSQGIWVLTEADEAYPARLVTRLGSLAPPVLAGAGPTDALASAGIAMVGSRDLDPAGEEFARALASRCAREQVTVISGGARGADRVSMVSALEAGGCAVGVLADSLVQTLRDQEAARFIRDEHLTLVTPFHPSAAWTVGNAMGRNKYLYCLADAAVVVSSGEASGGTWSGAIENIEKRWVPLFVRNGPDTPDGNRALIARGGMPLSGDALPPDGELLSLLVRPVDPPPTTTTAPVIAQIAGGTVDASSSDLYPIVWPRIEPFLSEPRTEQDVASAFGLVLPQAKAWLIRAIEEGRVELRRKPQRRYHRMTRLL